MYTAWSLTVNAERQISYGYNGGVALTNTGPFSLNQAHFVYVTADASTPQNLVVDFDNGTPATDTTTNYAGLGGGGTGYQVGIAYNTQPASHVCIAADSVYNDIENSSNLLAVYTWAHNTWATP